MVERVMRIETSRFVSLNDADLLREVHSLTSRERTATAQLIAALSELDARRLYLPEGCSSLFTYCTRVLHLSEHATYGRIEAARAARKWPVVLELLANGSLHLTAVTVLSRHLTTENHEALLAAARHKSKREIEEMVAAIRPQPAVPSSVRKVPPSATPTPEASRSVSSAAVNDSDSVPPPCNLAPRQAPAAATRQVDITPLAPARYKIQFTVTRETYGRLREAQDLLRHRIPNGDVGAIFDRALSLLLQDLHSTSRDRPASRPFARRHHRPPHTGGSQAGCLGSRRGSLCVRRAGRSLCGARLARVSPPRPVRRWRPNGRGQPRAALSRPQSL